MSKGIKIFSEKSSENWNASWVCHEQRYYNASASRLYYSLYLAVRIWGEREGKHTCSRYLNASHEVCRKWLLQEAKTNVDFEDVVKIFGIAQAYRKEADYEVSRLDGDKLSIEFLQEADLIRKKLIDNNEAHP